MASALNVEMGPVDVSIDGVDIGHCKGGAEVNYEPEYQESSVDAYGSTPIEARLKGERFTAKVRFAEFLIANLRKAMPQTQFAGAANARITVGAKSGKKASDDSVELVLHPSDKGTRENDVVMYKAVVIDPVAIVHNLDDDKVLEVTFTALVDESKADGNYLGLIGDSTA